MYAYWRSLEPLEVSQQELMSRLANSEAQIEEVKMETQGETDVFEDLTHWKTIGVGFTL